MKSGDAPRLLAGPAVRFCSADSVRIWFAFSSPAEVRVEVAPLLAPSQGELPFASAPRVATEFISGLYACVVECRLPQIRSESIADVIYRYTFEVLDLRTGVVATFEDYRLSEGFCIAGLSHLIFRRPSISLTRKLRQPMIFGSCRKMGGKGSDAGHAILGQLEQQSAHYDEYPVALLLTGDQAYVDDLPDEVFDQVRILCRSLGGDSDRLDAEMEAHPDRVQLVRTWFTSGGKNHLLSFREMCCLYLLSRNPTLWHQENDLSPTELVQECVEGARAWRTVLANVSSYAIFDDHEVSDDWNIDQAWLKRTREGNGQRIVQNALIAYFVFQGWGNDPRQFDNPDGTPTTALALSRMLAQRAKGEAADAQVLKRISWSFTTPTAPAVTFLDVRSRRGPQKAIESHDLWIEDAAEDGSRRPRLTDVRFVTDGAARPLRGGDTAMLVLTTPAFLGIGLEDLDTWVVKVVASAGVLPWLRSKTDAESWQANPENLDWLIKDFIPNLGAKRVITICGDVHYGFIAQGTVTPRFGTRYRLLQVTSSSMKNEPGRLSAVAAKLLMARRAIGRWYWRLGGSKYKVADVSELSSLEQDQLRARLGQPDFSVDFEMSESKGAIFATLTGSNFGIVELKPDKSVEYALIRGNGKGLARTGVW